VARPAPAAPGNFKRPRDHSLQNNFILDGIDNKHVLGERAGTKFTGFTPIRGQFGRVQGRDLSVFVEYGRSRERLSLYRRRGHKSINLLGYEYLRTISSMQRFLFEPKWSREAAEQSEQFGANIGGPLRRNKIFGFFNYEGTRIHRGFPARRPYASE